MCVVCKIIISKWPNLYTHAQITVVSNTVASDDKIINEQVMQY